MAQHISAKKRIRRNANRAEINRARVSRIRTFVRKVETAIATGDAKTAIVAFGEVMPELHRAVAKRTMHRNTVSRKLSRLHARIKALDVATK